MPNSNLEELVPIVEGRVYFLSTDTPCQDDDTTHYFSVDEQFVYYPVNKDNGPLSLNYVFRFCSLLSARLKSAEFRRRRLVLVTTASGPKRSCAAVLVGAFQVLCNHEPVQQVIRRLSGLLPPLTPFTDSAASPGGFLLSVADCLSGLAKAAERKLLMLETFKLREAEFYGMAEHGDMDWLVPGQVLALSSPTDAPTPDRPFTPENYVPYFRKHNVSLVVRLCSPMYDRAGFIRHGIDVVDLAFPDGGTPNDAILYRFVKLLRERTKGTPARPQPSAVAVHCKAGLGRTGTLVACYLMSDFSFTAREAIAYIRMARPGSIVAGQQTYLETVYERLKRGELAGL